MTSETLPIVLMAADEARACVTAINDHLTGARAKLLDLYEREGWRALGYDSWRSCVETEFGQTQTRLYHQLDAALVERNLMQGAQETKDSRSLETIAPEQHLPTDTIRPLARLAPEQQRPAWDAARELAGGATPTAKQTQNVVAYVRERVAEGVPVETAINQAVRELRLPTPSEADTLARESGLSVPATDGNYHDGRSEAELREVRATTHHLFAVYNALEALATHSMDPADFLAAVPDYQRYRVANNLTAAQAWLAGLVQAWEAAV